MKRICQLDCVLGCHANHRQPVDDTQSVEGEDFTTTVTGKCYEARCIFFDCDISIVGLNFIHSPQGNVAWISARETFECAVRRHILCVFGR